MTLLDSSFAYVVFLFLFFLFHDLNFLLGLFLFLFWVENLIIYVVFMHVTPLTHKHVFVSIVFRGIEFILIITITLIVYLGRWAFVVSITTIKFMVDQWFFFYETLAQVENNTFPFQQHLKAMSCPYAWPHKWRTVTGMPIMPFRVNVRY